MYLNQTLVFTARSYKYTLFTTKTLDLNNIATLFKQPVQILVEIWWFSHFSTSMLQVAFSKPCNSEKTKGVLCDS